MAHPHLRERHQHGNRPQPSQHRNSDLRRKRYDWQSETTSASAASTASLPGQHRKLIRMPTYQYRCQACHNDLEAFQKFTDDPLTICPDCGGSLRKVFNPVGIVFKGSGFYATDSRKSSSVAKPASTDHSTSTSTSSDSSAKSSSTDKASSEKTSEKTTAAA